MDFISACGIIFICNNIQLLYRNNKLLQIMEEKEVLSKGLPDNAYRELKEGEKYEPILSPKKKFREANAYSVSIGLIMTVLFSAAAAYLGPGSASRNR